MAEQNPKIQKWLDIGIRRFAAHGIDGINVNDMSKEVGVAKTSFYFFFNSKEEYLDQLFAYWEMEGTDQLYAMVNQISDPAKRFLALGKLIIANPENEFFYFNLKLIALTNEKARIHLTNVENKRNNIITKLLKDAGQSEQEIQLNRCKMKIIFYGQAALMMGYNNKGNNVQLPPEEIMKMLGIK